MSTILTAAQATAAATAMVDDFAPGAPADVKTAARQMVAQTLQRDPSTTNVQFQGRSVSWSNGSNVLRRCGAAGILAPWRRPRARPIKAAAS